MSDWPEIRIIRRADGDWALGFLEAVGPDDETEKYVPAHLLEEERERVEALEAALGEAVDMVIDWGSYASEYFQEKWDLEGDVEKLRTALRPELPASEVPTGGGNGELASPQKAVEQTKEGQE